MDPTTDDLSPELCQFESIMQTKAKSWKISSSHMRLALRLLCGVLVAKYDSSIEKLITSSLHAGEVDKFSSAVTKMIITFKWAKSTARRAVWITKKILHETNVDPVFIKRFRLVFPEKKYNKILGKKYGSLEFDHPIRKRLEAWIVTIRETTNNRSDLSIKNMMTFYLSNCLPVFGLKLDQWPENASQRVQQKVDDDKTMVKQICGSSQASTASKKARWLNVFASEILPLKMTIPSKYLTNKYCPSRREDDDGSDHHRISSDDLDKIYNESKKNARHELLYLLMITTGIRVGGAVKILIRHVVDIKNDCYMPREQGRTKEKGRKWVNFMLSTRVQKLIVFWLTKMRPSNPSGYLFPGHNEDHITTETVRNVFGLLCKNAGLKGQEFHPHALRHSYAHILLETGNSVDVVAKLMNHASASTTEKFYLKENAEELNARANIPWMKKSNSKKRKKIPSFLADVTKDEKKIRKHKRKKKRISDQLESLKAFAILPK